MSLLRRPCAAINAPLCATIQTLWLLKNPFFPLEKSSCGERLLWLPTAPRLPPLSLLPTLDSSALLGRFAFSLTLRLGQPPGLLLAPLGTVIPRFWVPEVCADTGWGGGGGLWMGERLPTPGPLAALGVELEEGTPLALSTGSAAVGRVTARLISLGKLRHEPRCALVSLCTPRHLPRALRPAIHYMDCRHIDSLIFHSFITD